ncbi:MAG: LuxR C-terminal-related transcriptional regulator [Nannocystaceae bacterium]
MAHASTPGAVDTRPHPVPEATSPSERWLHQIVELLSVTGGLTRAEQEVLEPLLLGREYREIAMIRGKSPHTIGVQVKMILRRLGASNSRDLLRVFLCELDRGPRCAAER